MNILFWGSSYVSVPFLEQLYNNSNIKIISVVTIPDKPQGRGYKILPSAVKILAERLNINIIETDNIKDERFYNIIKNLSPDLGVVVSYGKIIPKQIIQLHRIGVINIHFSLLPKYRGAAPVYWTLLNGDKETGVTIFWLDEGMDTGDIFLQKKIDVSIDDNYDTLTNKLVNIGCGVINEVVNQIKENKIIKIPQSGEPSYAPMVKKTQAKINWQQTADKIHNLVRAFVRWPKASTTLQCKNGKSFNVKIIQTEWNENFSSCISSTEGSIVEIHNDYLIVQCGGYTYIKVLKIQPENRDVLTIRQFLNGYKVQQYDKFV